MGRHGHPIPRSNLLPYDTLKTTFHLPSWIFIRYLQLWQALQSQFPQAPDVSSHMVESFLMPHNADWILSSLYLRISSRDTDRNTQLFQSWQGDIPTLDSDDWDEGVQQYISLMISAGTDTYIQLTFLHKAYYTPQRLARIYPTQSNRCPKCLNDIGTFIHVFWTCPLVQGFWKGVVGEINDIGGLHVAVDPRVLLLGISDTITPNTHKRLFIFYTAFYARKNIL